MLKYVVMVEKTSKQESSVFNIFWREPGSGGKKRSFVARVRLAGHIHLLIEQRGKLEP